MASLLLLLVCLSLGMLARRIGAPPEDLARSLNWWLLHVALPAMVLELIPHLQFNPSLWFPIASMWLIFCGSWWLFHRLGTSLGWPRGTIGAAVLAGGLSNTAFVGFPLIEALRGKGVLVYAAIADQLGSFICAAIGGALVVAMYSGGKVDTRSILRRVMLFPPFVALVAALIVALTPGWPPVVNTVLARISGTLAPIALFSVGLQLQLKLSDHGALPFFTTLGWKLGLAPLMIVLLGWLFQIDQPVLAVTVLQAAMAPMVTAAILCEQGNLDSPLANLMVGVGVLLSFITVPLWNLLV